MMQPDLEQGWTVLTFACRAAESGRYRVQRGAQGSRVGYGPGSRRGRSIRTERHEERRTWMHGERRGPAYEGGIPLQAGPLSVIGGNV